MAQKTVAGGGTGKKSGTSGGKMSAEDQEIFIKNLLVRCKSEVADNNDGTRKYTLKIMKFVWNVVFSLPTSSSRIYLNEIQYY